MSESMKEKKRVVVAMSGGVDSSVAAALMVEAGYEVIGMMMRLWSEAGREADNRCCTPEQMEDARRIADQLGIPFYAIDVQGYFRKTVVQYFLDQYAEGHTPNPCLECNRHIRFGFLLTQARALGADYLVTGHYAQIKHSAENQFELWKGLDEKKDQSYVLSVMGQAELAQTLFPVGGYTKPAVRQLAEQFGLSVAKKSDSMDLCFLGKDSYENFLRRNAVEIGRSGPILNRLGEQLGLHEGLPYYTIGQRKGLGISAGQPLFVLGKDVTRNALIVGTQAELGRRRLSAERVNWINTPPTEPIRADVKIRYKAQQQPATLFPRPAGGVEVMFDHPQLGVASGQGAVFYVGDRCLGGGVILPTTSAEEGINDGD